MAATYELIGSSTVGSGGAANIEFTSIPSTYTDLRLFLSVRSSNTGATSKRVGIRFNGASTDANLSTLLVYGDGSGVGSFTTTTGFTSWMPDQSVTSNMFSNIEIYIPNYTNSEYKSFTTFGVQENNAGQSYDGLFSGRFASTSAISSIKIFEVDGNNMVQYSTAYLYGIKNS